MNLNSQTQSEQQSNIDQEINEQCSEAVGQQPKINIIRVQEGEEENHRTEKMFEEVIVIKMSNLAEDINLQIQKYEET